MTRPRNWLLTTLFSAAALVSLAQAAVAPSPALRERMRALTPAYGYHLVKTVPLGAPEEWDYLAFSPTTGRVFVAHGNRLTVVDAASGRVVGQVGPISGGPHGIAFDPAAGVGITDDGRLGQAVIFSLKTLKVLKRVPIERGADAVTFDAHSGHAFVIDGDTGTVAVIDPARGRRVAYIHLGGDLEFAVPGDNGKLYVNGVSHREIFRIDTATDRVDAKWPIPGCASPHGLAIDVETHRLFATCENERMVIVSSNTGRVVATVPIGRGTDAARFDAERSLAFSANGFDGTLSVIHEAGPDRFVPVATVSTALSARTMALDEQTGRIFVVAAHTTRAAMQRFMSEWRRTHHRPKGSPFTANSFELLMFDPGP